jgi:hypothetical protein
MSVRVNRSKVRRSWSINPRERIVESKKLYDRQREKINLKKEVIQNGCEEQR